MQLTPRIRLSRFRKQEKGATIALVVVSMVALLGMAAVSIDYATAVQKRQTDQGAADAAALAVGNACALANTLQCNAAYATEYAKRAAGNDAVVSLNPATPSPGNGSITVKVTSKSDAGFAHVAFGEGKTTSTASSTATWSGVVKQYLPVVPLGFDYCQWKLVGNSGAEDEYTFSNLSIKRQSAPHNTCVEPETGAKILANPDPRKAVVMTGDKWWPTWNSSNCTIPNKLTVWQLLGATMLDAVLSTNAACQKLFREKLKPDSPVLVPLYANVLKKCSGLECLLGGYRTNEVKIVGFVPFKPSPGTPFYDAGRIVSEDGWFSPKGYYNKCVLSLLGTIASTFSFGCQKVKGSFIKTATPFPDAQYGTVSGYDPVKVAMDLKLTD